MRTGIRRSQQGGERGGGRPSTAGRRRRFGSGVLSFGCLGLLPCNGRGFDDHRRSRRTGRNGLSRSGDSRYERRMGDLQHQGGSDARHPHRHPHEGVHPGFGPQRGVRGDLYRCAGRFRHLVRNTHAGRLRHPHLCRQSQTHARRGIHPAGYERAGKLERHRK